MPTTVGQLRPQLPRMLIARSGTAAIGKSSLPANGAWPGTQVVVGPTRHVSDCAVRSIAFWFLVALRLVFGLGFINGGLAGSGSWVSLFGIVVGGLLLLSAAWSSYCFFRPWSRIRAS